MFSRTTPLLLFLLLCPVFALSGRSFDLDCFSFDSGGALPPEVVVCEDGLFHLTHQIGEEATEFGPFSLTDEENARAWGLIGTYTGVKPFLYLRPIDMKAGVGLYSAPAPSR